MDANEVFEAHRDRLRSVAYRIVGSSTEAEDAVQETWLRLSRVDTGTIDNLGAWLTTVVSRICLDMLRARREEPAGQPVPDEVAPDPGHAAELADSAGRALLVVLDRLGPAERVAFVLHDIFAVPFDEIAPIVDRSTPTTKKLASRARRKVRGAPAVASADLARQRRVIEAFLAAARAGDVDAVLAVLAPDVVRRTDLAGRAPEIRGARPVAEEIAVFGRSARFAETALVDGVVGVLIAPHGRLTLALAVEVVDELIVGYDLVTDPARLRRLDIAVLSAPVLER